MNHRDGLSISVVIPARNEEAFLTDCLRSLREQDYRGEYEIIVADNGSTDSTAGIARDFGARVVPATAETGVFYARQVGADAARGDIIAQADADTVYPRGWLRRLAVQLAAHPEAVAVSGRFVYGQPPWWAWLEYGLRHGLNRLTGVLFGRPFIVSGATLAFRRRAFRAVNGYRGLTYAADQYGISGRLSRVGKVRYDPGLWVSTSSRSVQKAAFIVVTDMLGHLNRWGTYLLKSQVMALREFAVATPARRRAAKLLPVPLLIISAVTYGYAVPTSMVFGKVYYEAPTKRDVVALTFDDGPNEPYTSQVLDILASHNIKATFFLIGQNVELYPDVTRRIIAEGNVIGNHSYSHHANHALTEYGAKDLKKAEGVILDVTGISPHLYYPPQGQKSPWELDAVRDEGMIEVTWGVSANDQHVLAYFGGPTPVEFAREIVRQTGPGGIVLLHDGYGTEHNTANADRSLTVQALPLIIEQLQARGYRFVTVPQLLGQPAYNGVSP